MKNEINQMRQNHPELVVRDIMRWVKQLQSDNRAVPYPAVVRLILKNRGINKWLRNRRLIIQLKHRWKERIKEIELEAELIKSDAMVHYEYADVYVSNEEQKKHHIHQARNLLKKYHRLMGEMAGMVKCRQQLRAICHSPRDIEFGEDTDWPEHCNLPEDFPDMPNKMYFSREVEDGL